MALRVMEPREPYNTKEDLLELAQEYRELKQNEERDIWKRARLAHEAAQKFDLKQFAKLAEENYDTLKHLSYIAGRYSEEDQKLYGITLLFKHFIVAAKADNRLEWLKKAQDNAWSAERLRREMNPPKPVEKKPPPVEESKLTLVPLPETKRHSWDKPEPSALDLAFRPFVEMFNLLWADESNRNMPMGEMLVLAFGVQEEYTLLFEPNSGLKIVNIKEMDKEDMEPPVVEGASQ